LLPVGPRFGRRLADFVRGLATGRTLAYLGHNPPSRIVLTLLVLSMLVQAVTGLVIAGTDVYMPPFGGTFREWAAAGTHEAALVRPYAPATVDPEAYASMRAFRMPWVRTHEYNFFVLASLIVIHIAAAVFAELREGGRPISAMFNGRKVFRDVPTDAENYDAGRDV